MTADDQFEERKAAIGGGLLDAGAVITKANNLLDILTPIVSQLANGLSSVTVNTTVNINGMQVNIQSVIKITQ